MPAKQIIDYPDVDVGTPTVAVLLVPEDLNRSIATLTLLSTSAVTIRVGSKAHVAAGRGQPVAVGEKIQLDVQGEIWGIRSSAGTAVVAISATVQFSTPA